jgi:hypothetical protein
MFTKINLSQVSLSVNVVVLSAVIPGIIFDAKWATAAYGPPSPARGILTAVYTAIMFGSAGLLIHPSQPQIEGLLMAQILYKFLAPFTVKSINNPVVISNLVIAAFHCVTLANRVEV